MLCSALSRAASSSGPESPSNRHCQRGANSGHMFSLSPPQAGQLLLISFLWLEVVRILKGICMVCVYIVQDAAWTLDSNGIPLFPILHRNISHQLIQLLVPTEPCEVWISLQYWQVWHAHMKQRGKFGDWDRTEKAMATVRMDVEVSWAIFKHSVIWLCMSKVMASKDKMPKHRLQCTVLV